MANIYEDKFQHLHQLLDDARAADATSATVVIPDLQRPYVWTPNQVVLLVDSLIRGWPFGTLLMWKVNEEEFTGIPHRPFWLTLDRTDEDAGTTVPQKNPPATSYHMVLDGQQRVQSLLLALTGDDAGFKLEDRDWIKEFEDRSPRGRSPKYKHWTKASLCFDLDAFLLHYHEAGERISLIDFRRVLVWAITDPTKGQSTWPKPDNYVEPLKRAFTGTVNLIRLSRLWQAARPDLNLKEKDFRGIVKDFLEQQKVSDDVAKPLLEPLGELMTTFRDVKFSKVTYLELVPFSTPWTRDSYNDAIVNVFTRLNTAGRALTREEITFAWLKSNWNASETNDKSATQCFTNLQDELKSNGLALELDDLVNAVSYMWSVRFNEGKLLANSDLLKGDVIRPMAADLSGSWQVIRESILDIIDLANERGLTYGAGGQYSSINALAVLWGWFSLARHWNATHALTTVQKDDFEKSFRKTIADFIDRWFLCSTWAGRWADSSSTAVPSYARELADTWKIISNESDYHSVHSQLASRMTSFVTNLESDATSYVTTASAKSRDRVSVYRNLLWIWHRLDTERWAKSRIALRSGKSKKTSLDVDHTLSFSYWERKLESGTPSLCTDKEEALAFANMLGNCCLLEKTFNISKSDKPLKSFLADVHEFKTGQVSMDDWARALGLSDALIDPSTSTLDQIAQAILERDKQLRLDLTDFVTGSKSRIDV